MIKIEDLIAILNRYPFAEELQPGHLEKLCAIACEIDFKKDEIIFREGAECKWFYLLMSGKVLLEIPVGSCVLGLETLGPGDELGWSSMLMRESRHFQARALEPVTTLAFDGTELIRACKADKSLGFALLYRVLGVVARRMQATRMRLVDVYSSKAEDAVLHV
jgi:CRP/FNR family transcriptional regulator, cyclic AMP receptor protein